jgi:hypothetical protein
MRIDIGKQTFMEKDMTQKANTFKPGDRVIAIDTAGISHQGHLHHTNQCGQFYFLPDENRQPFYTFASVLTSIGARQPGFASTASLDDGLGIDSIERQKLFVQHMQRFSR